jgi:hypothetical protein
MTVAGVFMALLRCCADPLTPVRVAAYKVPP